jgi:hypothetical protein
MEKLKTIIDPIFKIGLLVIGIVLAIVLFSYSQNGRYQFNPNPDLNLTVLDTSTGRLFISSGFESLLTIDLENSTSTKTKTRRD